MSPPDSAEIAGRLREIAAYLRLLGDNPYRARAYDRAAGSVEALGPALPGVIAGGRLAEAPGIGAAIAAVIGELFTTGTTRRLEAMRAELPFGLLGLDAVPGLTVARIRALHRTLGVRNLQEIEEAARAGRLRAVRGFGPRTEQAVLAGLATHRTGSPRIRLVDARRAAAELEGALARLPGVARVEAAGSVRRWQETVGTVRAVAAAAAGWSPAAVVEGFARSRPTARIEGEARDRVRAHLGDGTPVEVVVVAGDAFAAALLRETGPRAHLAGLEARAAARGLSAWEAPGARKEAEIYARLGLPVVPPELRDDGGVIEAAARGDDLADLVGLADLQGMVHCHTTYSDGRAGIEEMARAAEAMGMRYLTITDHSPAAFYAGGVTVDRLERQWEEIAAVQERVEIKLLRGTEADVLADGALDYPDAVLERLDVIIASVHNRFKLDEAAATARLVRAMRLPLFKIWGHPLGRLILRRDPMRCRLPEVLDAIAESPAAIEINGDPYRLDLPPEHLGEARRRGIKFVISTDAHSPGDLENLVYGVAMARRGGVRRAEVLNALPVGGFAAAVSPIKG